MSVFNRSALDFPYWWEGYFLSPTWPDYPGALALSRAAYLSLRATLSMDQGRPETQIDRQLEFLSPKPGRSRISCLDVGPGFDSDSHPKSHGCVRQSLHYLSLPVSQLRGGLFSRLKGIFNGDTQTR